MRNLGFVAIAASALAVAVPVASGGRPHGQQPSVGSWQTSHGKASRQGAAPGSSFSIALIAPWGTAAYNGSAVTVTYSISRGPRVPARAQTDVENALASWNSCFGGGAGCGGISPKNKFSFASASGAPLLSITIKKGGGVVAGSTKLSFDSSGFISGARLQISAASFGSANTDATITEIALHELGHVVGLGHSTDPTDLMYPVLNGVTSFGSCEVNGFNALYSSWLGTGNPTQPSASSISC
jgi:Matrixin